MRFPRKKSFLKLKTKKGKIIIIAIFALVLGIKIGSENTNNKSHHVIVGQAISLDLCFTPPSGCRSLIIREIMNANNSIYIHAYGFTSQTIVEALLEAKARGVEINILLDKSNVRDKYSKLKLLHGHGVNIFIDKVSGIAHNKVMIIDGKKVITGSYNFTNAAEKSNAENLLVINNMEVATAYLNNWHKRYLLAKKYDKI